MSLAAPAITELTTESGWKAIMAEWLATFFDGASHAVGLNDPVPFPELGINAINFDQGTPDQPMTDSTESTGLGVTSALPGREIRIVAVPLRNEAYWTAAASPSTAQGKVMQADYALLFTVSTRLNTWADSNFEADNTVQLLVSILTNPAAWKPIVEKGITHLTPRPSRTVPTPDCATRLIYCPARFEYPILWQEQS